MSALHFSLSAPRGLLPDQCLWSSGAHQELSGGAGSPRAELWSQRHPPPVAPPAHHAALGANCGRLPGITPDLTPPRTSRPWVQVVPIANASTLGRCMKNRQANVFTVFTNSMPAQLLVLNYGRHRPLVENIPTTLNCSLCTELDTLQDGLLSPNSAEFHNVCFCLHRTTFVWPYRRPTRAARPKRWSFTLSRLPRRSACSALTSLESLTLRTTHCFWWRRRRASSSPLTHTLSGSRPSYTAGPSHTPFTFSTRRCKTFIAVCRQTCTMETAFIETSQKEYICGRLDVWVDWGTQLRSNTRRRWSVWCQASARFTIGWDGLW